MVSTKDRRRSPRIASRFPVHFRPIPIEESGYRFAMAEDVSAEGVRFQCLDLVRPRSGMLLELMVPGDAPVRSFGRAAWVRELPDNGGFEVGGWFEDPGLAVRRSIARHLENLSAPART